MKFSTFILAVLFIPCSIFADEASHRAAAVKLLDMVNSREAARSSFLTIYESIIQGMKKQGMPSAAGEEMRTVALEWFDKEIKWEEIKPKLAELYMKELSEAELKEITAFYLTPAGKKALLKMPIIMQQASTIGQEYAASKQEILAKKMQAIVEKYRPKAPAGVPAQ